MEGPGSRHKAVLATVVLVAALVAPTLIVDIPAVHAAKKDKPLVACPGKVGVYKLKDVKASADVHQQVCRYDHPKPRKKGWAVLDVDWWPDEDGERRPCRTRKPTVTALPATTGQDWQLTSPTRNVRGIVSLSDEGPVSLAEAEAPLRRLVAAAEPLAHPCVPSGEPAPDAGPACPLLLPGDLVRTDWYAGDPQVAKALGDGSGGRFGLRCLYAPAYEADGGAVMVQLRWKEGDPGANYMCSPESKEVRDTVTWRLGYHPIEVEMSREFVERWNGDALADALVAAAAQRTQRCSDAPDGPAPYADAPLPTPGAPTTSTDIVLGGGPGEMLPVLGAIMVLPEDDQHAIVIGGPNGEVIREDFIGDHGTVIGVGPIVTDLDGNWSVLVSVEPATARAPSQAPTPPPTLAPSLDPEEPASPDPSDEPARTETGTSTGADSPATPTGTLAPTSAPPPTIDATPEATPWPEREEIPGLGPEAQAAVDNVADSVEILGEILEDEGAGEVTIPAVDIELLIALAPDLATSVKLGSGSIIVTIGRLDIHVIPDIGKAGLIEVNLSRSAYDWVKSTEVVQGLTRALNAGVDKRDGRFRTVRVTPEGITLTAEGPAVPYD